MRTFAMFCVVGFFCALATVAAPRSADAAVPLSLGGFASQLESSVIPAMMDTPVLADAGMTGDPALRDLYVDQFHRGQTWARTGGWLLLGGLGLTIVGAAMIFECFVTDGDSIENCSIAGVGLVLVGGLTFAFGQGALAVGSYRASRRLRLLGVDAPGGLALTSLATWIGSLVVAFIPGAQGVGGLLGLVSIITGAVAIGVNNRHYYRSGLPAEYGEMRGARVSLGLMPVRGGGGVGVNVAF